MIAKRDLVERLLYLTLGVVFLGLGIALYIAIGFGSRLSEQLTQLKAISQRQSETIAAIERGVGDIKGDNQQNTLYLKCLINFHSTGKAVTDEDCPWGVSVGETPSSAPTGTNTQPTSSRQFSSPIPTVKPVQNQPQQPTPTPVTPKPVQPTLLQQLNNVIRGLL